MGMPVLTFFCELESESLKDFFTSQLIDELKGLSASVSLSLQDLTRQRAEAVRRLNQAGIPVNAWLLLPKEEGYWLNLRNADQAVRHYTEFKKWAAQNNLEWARVGLDIEPDIREMNELSRKNWRLLPRYLGRLFARREWKRGLASYRKLVEQIRSDGYRVDTYQFPLISDERKAGSTALQRVFGLVNLPADREIWMLYSSFVRPHGAGILTSYAAEAQSIAVGSTGGGVESEFNRFQPLTWDELARDLRLAWYWCDDLHIYSLEGCVELGYMEKLTGFIWDNPILLPESSQARVDGWRRSLRSLLWVVSHALALLLTLLGGIVIWKGLNRSLKRRRLPEHND